MKTLCGVAFVLCAALAMAGCAQTPDAVETVRLGECRELRVNGQAFFPLMNFYQSPKSFDHAASAGLNGYFMPGSKPPPKEYLDALWARQLYGVVPFDTEAVGHPALLAWLQPHEPDALKDGTVRTPPEEVVKAYGTIRENDTSRPVVLDFSPNFMLKAEFAQGGMSEDEKRKIYPQFARGGDILTYNVYPIWGHNKPEKMSWVAEAADDLRTLVGDRKPFWAMIETGKGARGIPVDKQHDVSVEQIKAEVWMAITHGATGIIYFTHQFTPKFTEFGPDAAKQAGLRMINDQIACLAPIILSPPPKTGVAVDLHGLNTVPPRQKSLAPAGWMARRHGGYAYVFVLHTGAGGCGAADVAVEGLRAGTRVEVHGTRRTIQADDGSFTDIGFAPYELRIYRIRM